MRIHINALYRSSGLLNDTLLAQELWLNVNPEKVRDVLLFTFGNNIEQDADLHIEIIATNHIRVGFLLEDEYSNKKEILPRNNMHWLFISEWASDKSMIFAKFLTFLVGTIRTPSQMGTYMMDLIDFKKAMLFGTEATCMCLDDVNDSYKTNFKSTLSTIMLLNTDAPLSKKLSLAVDSVPQYVEEEHHLNILNITDNPYLQRTNLVLFIFHEDKTIH